MFPPASATRAAARRGARPVGHARDDDQAAAGERLVAAGDREQQARVDVAAGQDRHGRAGGGRRDLATEQRGDADGAGALHDELAALEQHDHRLGRLLVLDDRPCRRATLQEREREVARPLDRDAVGDRQRRWRPATGSPARERLRVGRARGGLHADDLDLRPRRLDRDRDAGREPAAADRHDDLREVRHLLEQLEPERALAGDDVRVVEGVHEGEPVPLRALLRGGDALVEESPPTWTFAPWPRAASTFAIGASAGT